MDCNEIETLATDTAECNPGVTALDTAHREDVAVSRRGFITVGHY